LAKPNYQFEKRQRDLAKKNKQEEKRRQKLAGNVVDKSAENVTTGASDAPDSTLSNGETSLPEGDSVSS
jgi:hypothetical protein